MTPANQALRAALKSGRKNKYGAEKCIVDGIKFASKKEGKRYSELKLLERVRKITCLQRQVRFRLYGAIYTKRIDGIVGEEVAAYVADFVYDERICKNKWQTIVEDTKGFRTKEYILKKKLMKANYNITIRET